MVFQFLPFLLQIAAGVALSVVAYLIMPKPKAPKPEVRDLEAPTASAGRPMPKLWGTKDISGVNILFVAEKTTRQYEVNV